jgi:hypothetical protein
MPSQLYLPESARPAIERDRAEVAAQFYSLKSELAEWNAELQRIDPRLRMVKAKENTPADSPLKAGYYHIVMDVPGHPSTILPLEYDNGEYREPGSWVYPFMEEQDMWNDRARRASRKRGERVREAQERRKEQEQQRYAEQFNERWRAANSTQISVSRDVR